MIVVHDDVRTNAKTGKYDKITLFELNLNKSLVNNCSNSYFYKFFE